MIGGPTVVDASVVVEYLVVLRHPDAAVRMFRRLVDGEPEVELWAPDLVYPEAGSALRALVLRRSIEAQAASRAIQRLPRLPIATTGTGGLLADAWKLRGDMTIYDACYVVLARRLGATLVTADDRLAKAVAARRQPVVHLADL